MKVKTNLTPDQLDKVGRGLQKLAAKQRSAEFVADNPAELELFRKANSIFATFLDGLQEGLITTLKEGSKGRG